MQMRPFYNFLLPEYVMEPSSFHLIESESTITIPLQLSSLMVDLEDNCDINFADNLLSPPVAAYDDLSADVEQGPIEDLSLDHVRGEEDVGHVVVLVIHLARLPSERRVAKIIIISIKAFHNGFDKVRSRKEFQSPFTFLIDINKFVSG